MNKPFWGILSSCLGFLLWTVWSGWSAGLSRLLHKAHFVLTFIYTYVTNRKNMSEHAVNSCIWCLKLSLGNESGIAVTISERVYLILFYYVPIRIMVHTKAKLYNQFHSMLETIKDLDVGYISAVCSCLFCLDHNAWWVTVLFGGFPYSTSHHQQHQADQWFVKLRYPLIVCWHWKLG